MADKNNIIVIGVIILVIVIAGMLFQKSHPIFAASGPSSMTRTAPTSATPGSTFTVTYKVAYQSSATWGASIQDSVSGGCTFPDGSTTLKTVMLSSDGDTKTITIKAPSSSPFTCTFSGDFKFGTDSEYTFPASTVTSACTPTCTRPSNLCQEASQTSNGCGGYCTGAWAVQKVNSDDTDCNNKIDRTELGVAINKWLSGAIDRNQLGIDIQSWSA